MKLRSNEGLRLAGGLAVLVAIVLALVVFNQIRRGSSGALGALDRRAPALDQPAPNFALQSPDGRTVKLSDLRGQVVLVNFWATWCIPCRDELPAIQQVYSEQKDQGFTVLEVNEQETPKAIEEFAATIGAMPPIVLDRDGSVMQQYQLKGLPDTFVVDRQGVVRGLSYGPVTRQAMLKYIDAARQSGR
jgi:cytochrome c biogenesis protein CcmG, thiol:disulfide interchange protein DsbE